MNKKWVLNASPIIVLGKADILKTVSPLAGLCIIPEGVYQEVNIKGPIETYLSDISSKSKIKIERVPKIHPSIAAWDLGQGESEVLTLGLKTSGSGVILDDLQAHKCAILFDIALIGSLGLIVLAKKRGLIDRAKPLIDRLSDVGLYIDRAVLNQILKKIGEDDKI